MSRKLWIELAPSWPCWGPRSKITYWDEWLRLPEQSRGRSTLRPEVSRTFTFGEQGTSNGQFYRAYLAPIRLSTEIVDWTSLAAQGNLQRLLRDRYDRELREKLRQATPMLLSGTLVCQM